MLALVTWPTTARPAERLAAAVRAHDEPGEESPEPGAPTGAAREAERRGRRGRVLASVFGTFLIVVVVSSIGNNGLTSQLANVMPATYGFSAAQTSGLLALSGLLNIPVIVASGAWIVRRSDLDVYVVGTVVRAVGALAMAVVGLFTTPVLVVAALAMLVATQGTPIPRVAASSLAVRLSPSSATEAEGYYFAASAVGAAVGCLLAGVLADASSFNGVNWLAAVAGAVASVVVLAVLVPRARRRDRAAHAHVPSIMPRG